ncbi:hypothetical protein [Microseira wollei]|uniref:Uncharacterized protein n=1 Tax=Microseira wollei NIES-4236 TaxID=2530354 RepID=A0AAV3XKJ0_9CYAN|nr:hypothetical protein [Microseira wollei]GET42994.1 hypothetical protein MiSe_78140 [Microseira wollei NIES-4236]
MLYNVPPANEIQDLPEPEIQFNLRNLIYTWNAEAGYNYKLDTITLPMLTILTKIASNLPVRVRLYQSKQQRQQDLYRPPYINPESLMQRGIFLDAILSGNGEELELQLSPVPVRADSQQCPMVIEKMFPHAATINLRFDFIG